MSTFEHLLSPGKIGTLEIRNRMVMPPMGTGYASDDGFVTERLVHYYSARSEGGMGLIIVEVAAVAPEGRAIPRQIGIWADKFIPGLRYLAGEIKKHGARAAIQLHHAGRQTTSRTTGKQPVAPSAEPCPVCRETPRELTVDEIKGLVFAFGQAARRAREAGFEAVEIHGTHGYLINQFLSPYSNRRQDEYGGDKEGRMRFPLAVIAEVRRVVGKEFPIIYRMNANEYVAGGLTPVAGVDFALRVEGKVDALHVSAGVYGSPAPVTATMSTPPLPLVGYAAKIKGLVNIPVIAVGKIHDPELGEKILREKKADFVAIGRGSITDSHFAKKVKLNQVENIRKCIQCNQKCIDPLLVAGTPVGCIYNPRAGQELEYPLDRARRRKKIVVVGGGPAGMEAARVAAERGHRVILFEQSHALGGQAMLAKVAPYKDRFGEIIRYLTHRLKTLKVDVRTGVAATAESVLQEKPAAVILATGSIPVIPSIPGLIKEEAVTARDVLGGKVHPAGRVAVVGGGLVGCETAEFLAQKGNQVILLEGEDELAPDQSNTLRQELVARLKENKAITIRTGTLVSAVENSALKARSNGTEELIEGLDNIVIAVGAEPYNPLEGELKPHLKDVFAVGDCFYPRNAVEAIHEAFQVAYRL